MDVSIVAPDKEVWRGEAEMVIARSPEGEFGILRGHAPFLAALSPGLVTVVEGGSRQSWRVPGGFLEASGPADDYHVIVLVDDAEHLGEVDPSDVAEHVKAMKELAQAKAERMMSPGPGEGNPDRT